MGYTEINGSALPPSLPKDRSELDALRRKNNPNNEGVGHYTGRCRHCGSKDLWEDNLAYGCNGCGGLLGGN